MTSHGSDETELDHLLNSTRYDSIINWNTAKMYCSICDWSARYYPKDDPAPPWLCRIRAIYRVGDTFRLSGVAEVPNHYSYNGDSYSEDADGEFTLFPAAEEEDLNANLPTNVVPSTSAVEISSSKDIYFRNATGDHFLHDACWRILRQFFDGTPMSGEQLVSTLSLSPPCTELGRLSDLDFEDPTLDLANIPAIKRKRVRSKPPPQPHVQVIRQRRKMAFSPDDIFTILPLELCYEVARYLPIADFYSLRFVSRHMADLIFHQGFWATRFDVHRERGFLSYCKERRSEEQPTKKKWHHLYQDTKSCRSIRKILWERCLWIKEVATMEFYSQIPQMPQPWSEKKDYRRRKVQTRFPHDRCPNPPEPLHRINIPHPLTAIVISVAKAWTSSFVTGLRFLSKEQAISIGNIRKDSSIIPVRGVLRGLQVAACDEGIEAINVIIDNVPSCWVGVVSENSTISSLRLPGPLGLLEASFASPGTRRRRYGSSEPEDPFAMTILTVGSRVPSSKKFALQGFENWIPEVPSAIKHFSFDMDAFNHANPEMGDDWPISWTLFGDQDGAKLGQLTQITVWIYRGRLSKICFAYGRRNRTGKILELDWQDCPYNQPGDFSGDPEVVFDIDGPGGERISQIEVVSSVNLAGATPRTPHFYKFFTNRGRSFLTLSSKARMPKKHAITQRQILNVTPGTTPVGLYGFKYGTFGQASLGVISAKLD